MLLTIEEPTGAGSQHAGRALHQATTGSQCAASGCFRHQARENRPLKQQSRIQSTILARVPLKASATVVIGNAVPGRSVESVSNSTRLPSGEPWPAKLITITSSSCAASNVPKIASDTAVSVACSSTRSLAASSSMVSANNAHRAMASRPAPLSSGITGSKCRLTPTKTAFSAVPSLYRSEPEAARSHR